jgi:hypothetical protein
VSRVTYGVSSKRYEKRKWPHVWTAVGAVLLAVLVAALAGYTLMRGTPAPTRRAAGVGHIGVVADDCRPDCGPVGEAS